MLRWARSDAMTASTRAARRTLAGSLFLLLIAGVLAAPITNSLQPFSSEDPGSESVAARHAVEAATGIDPYFSLIALVPLRSAVNDASARVRLARVESALAGDPTVAAVHSYSTDRNRALVSRDGRSTLVVGALRALPIGAQLDGARRVERRLASVPGVQLGGLAAFYAQGNDTARQDLIRAELFAFPLLLLICLWVFRGVIAALLPLLIGALTIVGTLAVLRLVSEATNVSIYALNIATALGLGLAVDYSLLIVSRYREEMTVSGPGPAALSRTMETAGRTIVISSITVAGVLSCLLVFPQPFLRSIGLGGILVAAIAATSALTVLPAILTLLSRRINSLSPRRWRRARRDGARSRSADPWQRISRVVIGRPWLIALVSAALLLGLSGPVLGLRITQVDANVVPKQSGARIVHDAIQTAFPASQNSPVFVAVSAPAGAVSDARLASYAAQLRVLPNVAAVEGPRLIGPHLWRIDIAPSSPPLSASSQRLVRDIRAMHSHFPVLAGGESASLVDLKRSLSAHIPLALGLLIAVTVIAVFVITGSAVLPAAALLASTLTITAAFGALVLVFQHGALEGLLDYTSSHALEAATLVLIFAMSFGLATDYGIFLLSRISEMREKGASNADAVARGLERTGRVVTAAALLLCVALGSLMTARHALVKEVGFGSAVAVAIDATLVRAMLLPAMMRLLGGFGWWSPGALLRAAPRRATARSRPEIAHANTLSLTPSKRVPFHPSEALSETRFCDHEDPSIRAALRELVEHAGAVGDRAVAVAAFEFVRDNVPYTLGPWGVPASQTLMRREGTCTNKANLLAALLRAGGIPAAYGVMRVNAREYFGAIGAPFVTRYMSLESTHVYAAAFLGGRWVRCDPSTDRDLSDRTAHFCQQTALIGWDGVHHAMDFLEPQHVYADLGLHANIDELLEKPARAATPERVMLWNDYLAFVRSKPPYASPEALHKAYRDARGIKEPAGQELRRAFAQGRARALAAARVCAAVLRPAHKS